VVILVQLLQEQQKNMMALLGHLPGGSLNTARRQLAGCGTQTAGLAFGGYDTAVTGATEEYDGSTWTTGGSLKQQEFLGGAGTQTAALAFGGTPTLTGATEEYDGTILGHLVEV
jgi:hypothetical protein